jgi:hypothetical protein
MFKSFAFTLSAVLIATNVPTNAFGQNATYFCSSESVAGLFYESSTKEWRSAAFRNLEKFVLKMGW